MGTKTRDEIEGLIRLFLVDGLPPNIKVIRIPVKWDWEGKLEIDEPCKPISPKMTKEEEKAIGLQKEDIQLEEFDVEGKKFLAGFGQLHQVLIVGYVEEITN